MKRRSGGSRSLANDFVISAARQEISVAPQIVELEYAAEQGDAARPRSSHPSSPPYEAKPARLRARSSTSGMRGTLAGAYLGPLSRPTRIFSSKSTTRGRLRSDDEVSRAPTHRRTLERPPGDSVCSPPWTHPVSLVVLVEAVGAAGAGWRPALPRRRHPGQSTFQRWPPRYRSPAGRRLHHLRHNPRRLRPGDAASSQRRTPRDTALHAQACRSSGIYDNNIRSTIRQTAGGDQAKGYGDDIFVMGSSRRQGTAVQ